MIQLPKKPKVKLTGEDGNIFNLIGLVTKALRQSGRELEQQELYASAVKEMQTRVTSAGSYDEALMILADYANIR